MLFGSNWWNRNVFSCRRKEGDRRCRLHVVWQSVPENGSCDRERATAGCWQTVLRTCSCSVNDDRRRRRPGRLDTGTSWFSYGGVIPFNIRYAMSASLKLTRSGRRSQCSIVRASEVEIPSELRRWVRSADVVGDRQEARQTQSCRNRA